MKLGMRGWTAVVSIILLWSAAYIFWFYAFPAPIELLGGDLVAPQKVHAGDKIAITRNFRVLRAVPITVTRQMIKGDCSKSCEITDLPSSMLTFALGEYRNIVREQTVPTQTDSGVWKLLFSIHWQGRFGRYVSAPLPELTIEVLP